MDWEMYISKNNVIDSPDTWLARRRAKQGLVIHGPSRKWVSRVFKVITQQLESTSVKVMKVSKQREEK